MIERLTALGDVPTVAILEVILREEVAHVAAGTRWFRHLCEREGREPRSTFRDLLRQHGRGFIRGPSTSTHAAPPASMTRSWQVRSGSRGSPIAA